jgi:hypothetical protein
VWIASRVAAEPEEVNVSIDPPPYNAADPHNPAPIPPRHPAPPGWQPGYGAQPAPGWGTPTAYPPAGYPMPPRKPPPKKLWYAVSAVLIVLGLFAIGVGIGIVANSLGKQPTSEHTFGARESTTLHIDAGETKVVYVANATAAGGHRVHCDVTGGQRGDGEFKRYPGSLTLNQWDATFTFTPSKSGEYTIRCTGAPTDTFGVGEDPEGGTILAGVLASIAGAFLLVVGLSALTVTAWLRRKRAA